MNFEEHLQREITRIRAKFAQANVGSMSLHIDVEGRSEAGDLLVEFRVGERYNTLAKGGDLDAVVDEALRRLGWDERHAPLCLPSSDTSES